MKLYYARGACSLACRILINELGLECDYISVDLKEKKTEQGDDFLKVTPKGAVPVLITDQGDTLTESAVIQQYLVDIHKSLNLLPAVGEIQRYHTLEWLNFITTDLHKNFAALFNSKLPDDARSIFFEVLKSKFSYVDKHLSSNTYLMGEHFTVPDSYLFVMLIWGKHFKLPLDEWQHLAAYYARLKQRQAIVKSLHQEGF